MSEKLEKLEQKWQKAEKQLTAAKHKEKYLEHEMKRLNRKERTHRLCTRAGMLEVFLHEHPNGDFYVMNGNRALIKREKFERYLDEATAV